MFSRAAVCKRYLDHAEQFADHAMFRSLEAGRADASGYDALLRRVALTHLNCPQLIAFLRSVAPIDVPERLRLEFLDPLDAERSGQDRPSSLETMLIAAGLGSELPDLRAQAREAFARMVSDPAPYTSLRDLGFAELVEAVAFEYLLDRMGRRISDFLQRRRGLPRPALSWFNRAGGSSRSAQGLNDILAYADCYRDDPSAAELIVDNVLRENVFVKRYFDWRALPAGQ
jgi:hypothetical protein